jgi:hypothetical protein
MDCAVAVYFIRRNRQFTTYRKKKNDVFKPIGANLSCDEKTTFKTGKSSRTQHDFYFIDFNAEEKRTVVKPLFNSNPGNTSGTHELAIALGTINKQLHFPVLCVLNSENEIIFQHSGYLKKN